MWQNGDDDVFSKYKCAVYKDSSTYIFVIALNPVNLWSCEEDSAHTSYSKANSMSGIICENTLLNIYTFSMQCESGVSARGREKIQHN